MEEANGDEIDEENGYDIRWGVQQMKWRRMEVNGDEIDEEKGYDVEEKDYGVEENKGDIGAE
jgi:hypothetical protein